jgi:hypothetical protein
MEFFARIFFLAPFAKKQMAQAGSGVRHFTAQCDLKSQCDSKVFP